MKIKFGTGKDPEWTEIDVTSHEVIVQQCYTGIGIETDLGLFGIAQRDGVLEIQFNGKLVIDADEMKRSIDAAEVTDPHKLNRR